MKQSRFSEQQIAFILNPAEEGAAVEEVCRRAGISIQTYYRWRKKYGGLIPTAADIDPRDAASSSWPAQAGHPRHC